MNSLQYFFHPLRQVSLPAKREPVLWQAGAQCIFNREGAVEVGGHVGGVVVSKIEMFGGLEIQ